MTQEYVESKVLSAPQLPGKLGEPKLIRIVEAIYKADYKKEGRAEANDMVKVNDLDPDNTNQDRVFLLTVPAIMKNELEKNFPKAAYVGQVFRFTRWAKAQGGKASPVELVHMKKAAK